MWHDIEAKVDLLNFSLVADVAAQLIRDSNGEPLTIGVSGGWGVGKSSLVKMVGATLQRDQDAGKRYIFLDFNAWLYQGVDDARQALLQSVSDKLLEVANERKTFVDRAIAFRKRIKWLKLARMAAPGITGLAVGATIGGPLGAVLGAIGGLVKGAGDASAAERVEAVKEAYAKLSPEFASLIQEQADDSLPQEIAGLRNAFAQLLADLDVTLVVLVDDLDRCLPATAIATLEAMRLLLHVPRTAFIIAADEQMIRGAVRVHFGDLEITDDLVTSYFDKLIQVPLRVPRLGVSETKAYLILLLSDLANRQKRLSDRAFAEAQAYVLAALRQAWSSGLNADSLKAAFGQEADKMRTEIDMAEQLAPLLVTAEQISGNPRLIKRFLNNLMIRQQVARAQGMVMGLEELVKHQLFERCASAPAFDFYAKAIGVAEDGRPGFLAVLEDAASRGEPYVPPNTSWTGPFYEQWVRLNPRLGTVDLRPLLYLSRDRSLALASYDELSPDARRVFEAALKTTQVMENLVGLVKALGDAEAERVLTRLIRKAKTEQWSAASVMRCFHCTKAFPSLGPQLASALSEIPAPHRPTAAAPLLIDEPWAAALVAEWGKDSASPPQLRNLITQKAGK